MIVKLSKTTDYCFVAVTPPVIIPTIYNLDWDTATAKANHLTVTST